LYQDTTILNQNKLLNEKSKNSIYMHKKYNYVIYIKP